MFKRGDGRWEATIQFRDVAGRTQRKVIYTDSESSAVKMLRKLRTAIDAGLPVADDRLTVADLARNWLEQEVRVRLRPATYKSYESHLRNHLIPTLGKHRLTKLTPADVESALNAWLKEGLSPRTVEYLRALLRRMLSRAERWGLVPRNVAKLVDAPKQKRTPVEVPEHGYLARVMETLRTDRLWIAYILALALGFRSGELRGLRWEDVDFGRNEIRIRQAMQRFDGKLQPSELKTAQSTRTLPMLTVAREALVFQRDRQELEKAFAGDRWQDHGLVVTTSIGTPVDSSNLVNHFQKSLKDHGFEKMTIHQLRHACASYLVSWGVDITIVKEILGHSQISLTADTYSHVLPAATREALSRMDAIFEPSAAPTEPAAEARPPGPSAQPVSARLKTPVHRRRRP